MTDYAFYLDKFHGTMCEDDFDRLIIRASAYIRQLTFGRDEAPAASRFQNEIHMARCAVADTMLLNEKGGGVVSETNDGVSVTYAASKSDVTDAQRLHQAASLYLAYTGLMFQGVGLC